MVLVLGTLDSELPGDEAEDGLVSTDVEAGGDVGGYGFDLPQFHGNKYLIEMINFCGFFQYSNFE